MENNQTEPKVHELKTWPEYFQAIKSGIKSFEIRNNDRGFKVGDVLHLKEWKPTGYSGVSPNEMTGHYTGEEMRLVVTYIFSGDNTGNSFGLMGNVCVMAIKPAAMQEYADLQTASLREENERLKNGMDILAEQLLLRTVSEGYLPYRIYLQADMTKAVSAATWSEDRINDTDVCYTRMDTYEHLQAEKEELVEALQFLMKGVEGLPPLTAIEGVLIPHYEKAKAVLSKHTK